MSIIFTFGTNNKGRANVRPDANGLPTIHVDGSCNVLGKLDMGKIRPIPLMIYGQADQQPKLKLNETPSLIFNQISDADSHSVALGSCEKLCQALPSVPVINHPSRVLMTTRDQVSGLLQGIDGLTMPRTFRCAPSSPEDLPGLVESNGLEFPVILRSIGQHNASGMVKIDGPTDLDKLHIFAFDGREFYLTEFVESADESGFYHKQRIIFVDGEVFLRHAVYHDHWIVNSTALSFHKDNPEAHNPREFARDLEANRLPRAMDALGEISRRIKLDYFGVDCSISPDGHVFVWEANATMNNLLKSLGGQSFFDERLEPLKQALIRMIEEKSGESFN